MCADYWASPVVSLGPAVISRIASKPGDYYEDNCPRSGSLLTDMSYDAALHHVILFGGQDNNGYFNGTWQLIPTSTPTPTLTLTPTPTPSSRMGNQ